MSRKRRGNLKGWWRYLPFILVPFGLLFTEVWLQTQILNNEYRKNALRLQIRDAQAELDELSDEIRELARMERVLERAPDLGLVPPDPGQVVEIHTAGESAEKQQVLSVAPVLAAPPKRDTPMATVKSAPPAPEPVPVLDGFDLLEPQDDWSE